LILQAIMALDVVIRFEPHLNRLAPGIDIFLPSVKSLVYLLRSKTSPHDRALVYLLRPFEKGLVHSPSKPPIEGQFPGHRRKLVQLRLRFSGVPSSSSCLSPAVEVIFTLEPQLTFSQACTCWLSLVRPGTETLRVLTAHLKPTELTNATRFFDKADPKQGSVELVMEYAGNDRVPHRLTFDQAHTGFPGCNMIHRVLCGMSWHTEHEPVLDKLVRSCAQVFCQPKDSKPVVVGSEVVESKSPVPLPTVPLPAVMNSIVVPVIPVLAVLDGGVVPVRAVVQPLVGLKSLVPMAHKEGLVSPRAVGTPLGVRQPVIKLDSPKSPEFPSEVISLLDEFSGPEPRAPVSFSLDSFRHRLQLKLLRKHPII
jgi:hypothetical protein